MFRLIGAILSVPIVVVAVLFALANTVPVQVTYSPAHAPASLPLFLFGYLMLLLGFVWGAALVWLTDLPVRLDRRRQRKVIRTLEDKLQAANENTTLVPQDRRYLP